VERGERGAAARAHYHDLKKPDPKSGGGGGV
jgi:hypothetical protein